MDGVSHVTRLTNESICTTRVGGRGKEGFERASKKPTGHFFRPPAASFPPSYLREFRDESRARGAHHATRHTRSEKKESCITPELLLHRYTDGRTRTDGHQAESIGRRDSVGRSRRNSENA